MSKEGGKKAREFGLMIEERIIKMFRGKKSYLDEVDFETAKCLYEVKSCSLFNKSTNSNQLRNKSHKRIESTQLGRFFIKPENHVKLWLQAKKVGKIPKYVFCLRLGKQIVFRVLNWDDLIVPNTDKESQFIRIKDIFKEKEEKKKSKIKPRNLISEMIEKIKAADKGQGADVKEIAKTDPDKELIIFLKNQGDVFECTPGRVKIISGGFQDGKKES